MPNKKGADIRTPTIPITLKGESSFPVEVMALLDSGADISVIPKGLADVLNLKLSEEVQSSFGIGGEIKVKNSNMTVIIKKNHENYNFTVPVQIILNGEDPPIILGRKGFFDKFIISFDEEKQKVQLKRKVKN